jgi:hypothetical protein
MLDDCLINFRFRAHARVHIHWSDFDFAIVRLIAVYTISDCHTSTVIVGLCLISVSTTRIELGSSKICSMNITEHTDHVVFVCSILASCTAIVCENVDSVGNSCSSWLNARLLTLTPNRNIQTSSVHQCQMYQ